MTPEEFELMLAAYGEWAAERLEIIVNIHAAELRGEITPEQAQELKGLK